MKHNFDTLTRQGDMKLDKENIRNLYINLWICDKILNKLLVIESINDLKEQYTVAKWDYFQEFKDNLKKNQNLLSIFYKR